MKVYLGKYRRHRKKVIIELLVLWARQVVEKPLKTVCFVRHVKRWIWRSAWRNWPETNLSLQRETTFSLRQIQTLPIRLRIRITEKFAGAPTPA
jgi:hypothetical protein